MNPADLDRFCGMPYSEASFDCADFVAHVQAELFNRAVQMPGVRPRGVEGQAAIGRLSAAYAVPTDAPRDGDLVLMFEHGQHRPGHAGVYFRLHHEDWVLHLPDRPSGSVLHRVRDLPDYGLRLERIYAWAH